MPDPLLQCTEIEPDGQADATVVWLHGLGADGDDFLPAVPHLGLPADHAIRFVFPTAEAIPVTINAGFVMPAWYDVSDLDLDAEDRADVAGLRRAVTAVRRIVAREVERGIDSERIVLAGFSQGGAVALELALTQPERLAGLVLLSTYLVDASHVRAARTDANRTLAVLQCHGTYDPMVPLAAGEAARDALAAMGHDVSWNIYPMQHEVCAEELHTIGRFLESCLQPAEEPA